MSACLAVCLAGWLAGWPTSPKGAGKAHDWGRVWLSRRDAGWQDYKAPNLGHCWSRALQVSTRAVPNERRLTKGTADSHCPTPSARLLNRPTARPESEAPAHAQVCHTELLSRRSRRTGGVRDGRCMHVGTSSLLVHFCSPPVQWLRLWAQSFALLHSGIASFRPSLSPSVRPSLPPHGRYDLSSRETFEHLTQWCNDSRVLVRGLSCAPSTTCSALERTGRIHRHRRSRASSGGRATASGCSRNPRNHSAPMRESRWGDRRPTWTSASCSSVTSVISRTR